MQHRVVADRQAVGLENRYSVQIGIHQHIVGDRHVLVIHRGATAVAHRFVAQEDALGIDAGTDVENIALDRDIRAGAGRAGGEELDHVGVIGRGRRSAEVMDIVAFDHHALDTGEVQTVGPQAAQFVFSDGDAIRLHDRDAFPEPGNRIVLDDNAGIAAHRNAVAGAIAILEGRHSLGIGPVKGRVADRDVVAVGKAERSRIGRIPRLERVIKSDPVKGQVGRAIHIGRREHRRIGGAGRFDRHIRGKGDVKTGSTAQIQITIIATLQQDGLTAAGGGQRAVKLGQIGNSECCRHELLQYSKRIVAGAMPRIRAKIDRDCGFLVWKIWRQYGKLRQSLAFLLHKTLNQG